ncbi:NAD-dependent epimerase/dehydratase family protein [Lacticaseibacillus casei]|uniref:NAD-dependent epimerase/dehydratase family protein n=1 Tax=Lacticaseibacillus casei TaxID=1582 RepID=UPI001CDBBB78|nr:NAD-dependent epimerase/dehydratase family protein [Lacticaseibacillus casei]
MKKVVVIGAFGTIGSQVAQLLRKYGYDVITASRHQGDVRVDIADLSSIERAF